jgi:CBS domain-containing membrane protein
MARTISWASFVNSAKTPRVPSSTKTLTWLRGFLPRQSAMTATERVVAMVGGLAGIALTAMLLHLFGVDPKLPLIIAPMGASAVLVFVVPTSPLAQPWSVIGGNTLSALAGVTAMQLVPDPTLAAALAVAGAIGLMSLARCVHPPGGAVALTAVVGGPVVHALGFGFVLVPVALSSLLLVSVGLAFNNGVRRSYPHIAPAAAPVPVPARPMSISRADLEVALAKLDEKLDLDVEDLEALMHEAMLAAEARHAAVPVAAASRKDERVTASA